MSTHAMNTSVHLRRATNGFALAGAILAMCVLWRDGVTHLVSIWWSSDAYGHGLFVLPAAILLIGIGWDRSMPLSVWPKALWGVAAGAGAYTLGTVTDARLFQHIGIAFTLISLPAAFLGRPFAWHHRFALLFMLTMIPVGDSLIPLLREITATAIMGVLSFVNIEAVKEGWLIRTTVGDFSVARACAGLRFLLATFTASLLLIHLLFTDWRKQVGFLLMALFVPVIANGLRATLTVIIAHKSGLQIAAGVDHLLYGWIFFGGIMAVLGVAALMMADPDAPHRPDLDDARSMPDEMPPPRFLALVAGLLVAGSIS